MPTSKSGLVVSDELLEILRSVIEDKFPDRTWTDEGILGVFDQVINQIKNDPHDSAFQKYKGKV